MTFSHRCSPAQWGVRVTRVEIQEIKPFSDILTSMEKQLAADRDKRALVLKSEGEREARENNAAAEANAQVQQATAEAEATVLQAKAEAESTQLRAAADAEAIRLRGEATRDALLAVQSCVGQAGALQLEALRQYTDANAALAVSPNTKTFVLPRGDEWLSRIGLAVDMAGQPKKGQGN